MYPQIAEKGAITSEIRLMRKDGVIINAILNIAAFDKNDLSGGIIFSILDITARKQAEEGLRQSEEKYRLIVENTLDVIFTTDEQEKYVYISPSVNNMLGRSPSELIGKPFVSIVHPEDASILKGEINNTYAAGYKFSSEIEYRLLHASGEWRWVVSRGTRVVDTNGKFLYFIGIIKDITERKQAEAALKQSEQNLRNSMDSSVVGIYIVNKYVNKAFLDIFGYQNMAEVTAKPPHEYYTPASLAGYIQRGTQLSLGEHTPDNFEVDIIRKDGSGRHLQISRSEVVWDGELRRQVFYHDITARKQAEEALKESERRYRSLFENMTNGYAYCRMFYQDGRPVDFQYINVNKAFEKQTGLTGVEGKLVSEVIPGILESDPELFERYGRVALTGIPESFEMYVASLHMWFSISVYSPQREYFVAIFDVITERKLAEQAVRESEARYKTLFESAAEGILIADILTREQKYANPAICKMLGYTQEELTKMEVNDIHPPGLRDFAAAEFDAQVRGEKTIVSLPCLRKDGTIIYMDISAVKTIIDGRECNVGFFTDITARKQAEDALKASEEKYSALVEESGDGIIILDDRMVVFANQKMMELTGYHSDELYGKIFTDLIVPEYMRMWDDGYRVMQAAGAILPASLELELLTKDGGKLSVEIKANRIMVKDKDTVMVTIRDVTERKLAEEKILASLAEKETLLKEVHHRVKNNMQVISSLLRLQERKVKDKDSAALLKESQNRIQSMALVYNKLYRSENLASINMTEYINELTQGLVKSYAVNPSGITLQVAPGGVFLDVDLAIPCGMVVNELVTNSLKYAFPDNRKGLITVSLTEDDKGLRLTVSDDGVGIPENVSFDNTSTLGIKLVSNLVRDQLGGKMELTRGRGTTVRITFRRVKEEK
jgi:PAS domain S-box-containing protein